VPGCAGSPLTGRVGVATGRKMARRAAGRVNNKRIRRLWREEGLRVPQRRRKKRLTGIGGRCGRDVTDSSERDLGDGLSVRHDRRWPHHQDAQRDRRVHREALAIEVDRGIDADGVVDVLDRLALTHGAPHYVRFDNGPEFVAHAVSDWCRFNSAGSLFIDPGSPWQNAWIESFNGRLRDELLNAWRFDSLLEAG